MVEGIVNLRERANKQYLDRFKSVMLRIVGLWPLSFAGMVLGLLLVYVWFFEVSKHANQILFALTLCLGVCIFLFLLFTCFSSLWIGYKTWAKNRSQVLSGSFDAESEIWTEFHIFHPFFIPFIDLELSWQEPLEVKSRWEGHGIWLNEIIEPQSRGRIKRLTRRLRIGDIFGICSVTLYFNQDVDLLIKPAPALLGHVAVVREMSGEGYSHPSGDPKGELVDMRRYQAGDPLRLVLWRVFARSRQLLVRSPEVAVIEHKNLFVYFVAGHGDDASASLARDFLEKHSDETSQYLFGADGSNRLVHSKAEGMVDVIHSSSHRKNGGEDLTRLAAEVPREMLSNCFIMVPCEPGAWVEQISKFVATLGVRPVFILGLGEGFEEELQLKSRGIGRFLFSDKSHSKRLKNFRTLYGKLSELGEMRVVFPKTGNYLSASEVEALRKL